MHCTASVLDNNFLFVTFATATESVGNIHLNTANLHDNMKIISSKNWPTDHMVAMYIQTELDKKNWWQLVIFTIVTVLIPLGKFSITTRQSAACLLISITLWLRNTSCYMENTGQHLGCPWQPTNRWPQQRLVANANVQQFPWRLTACQKVAAMATASGLMVRLLYKDGGAGCHDDRCHRSDDGGTSCNDNRSLLERGQHEQLFEYFSLTGLANLAGQKHLIHDAVHLHINRELVVKNIEFEVIKQCRLSQSHQNCAKV